MTTRAEHKHVILKVVAALPGIAPAALISCAATEMSVPAANSALKQLMTGDGWVFRTGRDENSRYYLTDLGKQSAAEQGFEVVEPTAGAMPESSHQAEPATAETEQGGDQVITPLPVIDSDRLQLDEALAQLNVLIAETDRPVNLFDLIEFNRRGAAMIRAKAPVPAALMESSANALERAYCQQ